MSDPMAEKAGPRNPQSESEPCGAAEDGGAWTDLCAVKDLPAQGGKYVGLPQHSLAVFRLGQEQLQVIDDACPHAGGSLASGYVAEGKVYCPWHAWPFNLADGKCCDNDRIKVRTYPVRVVDGKVQAKL